jgi:hypothetical protein
MQSYVSFAKVKAKPMTWFEYELSITGGDIYISDGTDEVESNEDGYLVVTEINENIDYVTWISKEYFSKMYMPLLSDSIM